jgi:hypothetical protein
VRTPISVSGVLTDKIQYGFCNRERAFGQGLGGVADLKVGPDDGYLYVFSFFNSAIYKILTAFSVRNSKSDLCFYYGKIRLLVIFCTL